MKTLSTRQQCGHNRVPVGSSRFDANGTFKVKTDDGRWVSFARHMAEKYCEKFQIILPHNGVRIEVQNSQDIRPKTVMVKVRGGGRQSLCDWVKANS